MTAGILDLARIASWTSIANGGTPFLFHESDIFHDGTNYNLFSTATENPGNVQIYTAATLAGLISATPVRVCGATVNLTNAVDNGDGTVTFTVASGNPVITGCLVQVQGRATFSNNGTFVAGTRVGITQTFILPGTSSATGAGGTVRISLLLQYPTAVLDSTTWHIWAINQASAPAHYTTTAPISSSSVWTLISSVPFGTGNNVILDPSVRKHPTDGFWYAVGLQSNLLSLPVIMLRTTNPNGATPTWTNFGQIFSAKAAPSWAASAMPDPNMMISADGRTYVGFTGQNVAGDYQLGMVEVTPDAGKIIGDPALLRATATSDAQGYNASDLVYLSVASEPDRLVGFTNNSAVPLTTLDFTGIYGEGYTNNLPTKLRIRIGAGTAGALVDFSNDIRRTSYRQKRNPATGTVTATFELGLWLDTFGGTRYVIQDWQEVRVDDTFDATYQALFFGYTTEVTDRIEGAEKVYTVTCTSVNIDLDKPTRQITTQYPAYDGTTVANTTSVTNVTAGSGRTFVVPDASALYAPYTDSHGHAVGGRRVIAQNADGTNKEIITVSAIAGGGVITADFTLSKTGSVTPWTITGGLSDFDVLSGGFKQMNSAGVRVEFLSLIDEYYNYPPSPYTALPVIKSVGESAKSLPHLKFQGQTIRQAQQTIIEQAATPNSRTTVSTNLTAGTNRTVTPLSMTNITAGAWIYCSNADTTNSEQVYVKAINSTQFTADFQSSKTGSVTPWVINTGHAPFGYMTWDNDFNRKYVYYDVYLASSLTSINLTDSTSISTTTQAHYNVGHERRISGVDRGSKVTVIGYGTAQGSYEDTAATAAMGRVVELAPVKRDDLLTNAECVAAATTIMAGFSGSRETITGVSTHSQISPRLFIEGKTVSFENALEGGTPARYAIADLELTYAKGIAEYVFTLGDRLAELGDGALPSYGAPSLRDFTPPEAPTWAAANAWVLSNAYSPRLHQTFIRVQATLAGELDLSRVFFQYSVDGGPYVFSGPVNVSGGATSANYITLGCTPGGTVAFQAWAEDTSRNISQFSSFVSVVASVVVLPNAPTGLAAAPHNSDGSYGYWNPYTHEVDVSISYTPSTSPDADWYYGTTAQSGRNRVYGHITASPWVASLLPGGFCTVNMYTVDTSGNLSLISADLDFTTIGHPPNERLGNPDFAELKPPDYTDLHQWTITDVLTGTGLRDTGNTGLIAGPYSLQAHVGTIPLFTPPSVTALSDAVTCANPTSSTKSQSMHVKCGYYTNAATGFFSISVLWYDKDGTLLGTDIPTKGGTWSGTPVANSRVILDSVLSPRATAITCKLKLYYESTGTANNLYFGGCALEPGTSSNSITAGNLFEGMITDGGSLTGGQTSIADTGIGVSGDGTTTPDNQRFYKDDGVTQFGTMHAEDDGTNQTIVIDTSTVNGSVGINPAKSFGVQTGSGGINLDTANGEIEIDFNGNYIFHVANGQDPTSTEGFIRVPTLTGPPTGTPSAHAFTVPFTIDETNSRIYFYIGGAWKYITVGTSGGVRWEPLTDGLGNIIFSGGDVVVVAV